MDTADKIVAVNKYVEAFANSDIDIIKQIYSHEAMVEDPVGTDPHKGMDAIVIQHEIDHLNGIIITDKEL